jgi:hypothetical protein
MSARSTRRRFAVASDPYRFNFPIDMLRYDACWPESQTDVLAIENPQGHAGDDHVARVVLLSDSASEPERARWASFGWRVIYVERVR